MFGEPAASHVHVVLWLDPERVDLQEPDIRSEVHRQVQEVREEEDEEEEDEEEASPEPA